MLSLIRHLGAKIHWNSNGEGDPHMQDPLGLCVLRGKRVFCLALRSHHNHTPVCEWRDLILPCQQLVFLNNQCNYVFSVFLQLPLIIKVTSWLQGGILFPLQHWVFQSFSGKLVGWLVLGEGCAAALVPGPAHRGGGGSAHQRAGHSAELQFSKFERGGKALQACKPHPAAPSPLEIPFCCCCKCVSSFLYEVVAAQLIPQRVLKGPCWKR